MKLKTLDIVPHTMKTGGKYFHSAADILIYKCGIGCSVSVISVVTCNGKVSIQLVEKYLELP